MMTSLRRVTGVLLFTLAAYGQEPGAAGFAERNARYRVGISDVLEIQFRLTPEFNQVQTVMPDGFIALTGASDLKVAGLTLTEVAPAIKARYEGTLRDPLVTVTLKEFQKPQIVVGGHVAHPGRMDLRGETSVSDAIAMAGGFTPGAKSTEVLLFRRRSAETVEVKRLNVKNILAKAQIQEDVKLEAGDSLFVPQSRMGAVDRFMSVTRMGVFFNPSPYRY